MISLSQYIKPLVLGTFESEKSDMMYKQCPGERIDLDITFSYIGGSEKNILVDTGGSSEIMEKQVGHKSIDFQTFEEALDSIDLTPKDIDIVIQTHLHFDHCAFTSKCTNAKVVVQIDEYIHALAPHPVNAQFYNKEFLKGWDKWITRGDEEIVDGVKVLLTPGHTPGGQSVVVETSKGKAVIPGWCCTHFNFKKPNEVLDPVSARVFSHWEVFPTGTVTDTRLAYESALRVKSIAEFILPCHGPGNREIQRIP